jgi:hypothetical protein
MFWSKKRRATRKDGCRQEPPIFCAEKNNEIPPSDTSENVATYAELLGVSPQPDVIAYRNDFGSVGPKNADGIPLSVEDQAEAVAQVLASSYEERYDTIKAQMKSRGMQFSALVKDDNGNPIAVNFAAVAAAPVVSDVTDEPELVPYCVAALHWLLASSEKEWVYSHLVEATGAYYRCQGLQDQLDPGYADDYDDLRGLLREALRQYIHRNV